jgi:hypothetical protein
MSRAEATPAELKHAAAAMDTLKTELMRHAHAGANQAGFQKADENAMAALMILIGAAQAVRAAEQAALSDIQIPLRRHGRKRS